MRVTALLLGLGCVLLVSGCADIPELEGRVSEAGLAAPAPKITPYDPILDAGEGAEVSDETTADLLARAAALKARAARIRQGL